MDNLQLEEELLDEIVTNQGKSLAEHSQDQPILLVFLRHFGCTFCREALGDIAARRGFFQEQGAEIILVHMSDFQTAEKYFKEYKLSGITHISDPNCTYYKHFGLMKGSFKQLFGLKSWMRGYEAGIKKGVGIGKMLGDGFQMPGVFVIDNNEVREQFIHKYPSDQPDYDNLLACCTFPERV